MQISSIPSQLMGPPKFSAVITPMGPTRPQVPMPEATAMPFSIWKTQVEMGPVTAAARVGGIQMRGLRTMLPICSMEVPRPWAMRPPHLFSGKLITAKPIIWAQQPAVAAPPARPTKPMVTQMAAELMGRVRIMPTMTETRMPMTSGCSSVVTMIRSPRAIISLLMAGPTATAMRQPTKMVTQGVTRISILVSLETSLPHSQASTTQMKAPRGPPNV